MYVEHVIQSLPLPTNQLHYLLIYQLWITCKSSTRHLYLLSHYRKSILTKQPTCGPRRNPGVAYNSCLTSQDSYCKSSVGQWSFLLISLIRRCIVERTFNKLGSNCCLSDTYLMSVIANYLLKYKPCADSVNWSWQALARSAGCFPINFGAVFNFGPVKLRKQKLIMSVGYSVDKKNPTQLAQPGQGSYILCWLVILFDKGAAKKVLCTVYNWVS